MSAAERSETTAELPAVEAVEALAANALEQAAAAGASAAEVGLSASRGLAVKVRRGAVETLEHMRDRGLAVTVYFGQRKASASSSDYGPRAVAETVRSACDIARHTSEDPYAGLAEANLMATEFPELSLYHPWALTPPAAIEIARECEASALAQDPRLDNSEGADVDTGESIRVYANSHGFMGSQQATQHSLSCVVLGRQGDAMERDYWYTVARSAGDLESASQVGAEAARRTLARLGARRIATTTAPVLFAADAARSLFGHLVGAVSGGSLYRKASFLLDAAGTRIFPEHVSLHEQPHLRGGLGSSAFDAEGVATRPRALVDNGVLQGYVLSSYSARRLGLQTTGNAGGVHNLTVGGGERGFDELIRDMGHGLVVTHLMGQGVNTVTGDYSRGAAGFWVENGEIAYPVEEVTVAGNLSEMFAGIAAVGRDTDIRGGIRTGSVLVDAMTVAGS